MDVVTDRISEEGNAIASVYPSVHPFVYLLYLEPLTLNFCMLVGHDHSSQGTEGHRSRLKVKGQARGQTDSISLTLHLES